MKIILGIFLIVMTYVFFFVKRHFKTGVLQVKPYLEANLPLHIAKIFFRTYVGLLLAASILYVIIFIILSLKLFNFI